MKRFWSSKEQKNLSSECSESIMISWANSNEQCFPEDMTIEKNILEARKNLNTFPFFRV